MSGRTSGEHRAKPLDNHPKAAQPPPIEPAYPLSRGYKCIAITFFLPHPAQVFPTEVVQTRDEQEKN